MKLKTPKSVYNLSDRLWKLWRTPRYIFITIMILYNILIIGLVVSLFHGEVPYSRRQRIINDIKSNLQFSNIIKFNSEQKRINKRTKVDHFSLEIDENDLNRIRSQNIYEIPIDNLVNTDSFSARIIFNRKTYEVDLRPAWYICTNTETNDNLSFDVLVKNDMLKGMRQFRLYRASQQAYLDKWLLYQIIQDYDLNDVQYEFVDLSINGSKDLTFIIEKSFNDFDRKRSSNKESIAKFQLELSKYLIGFDPRDFDLMGIQDPGLIYTLLNSSYANNKDILQLFDISKLAKYCAILDLFGVGKSQNMEHFEFRWNFKYGLFEPFISNLIKIQSLERVGLIGSERTILNGSDNIENHDFTLSDPFDAFYQSRMFYEAYIQELDKIGSGMRLKEKDYSKNYGLFTDLLQSENSHPFVNNLDLILQNKEYIRKAFNPSKQLHIYYNEKETSMNEICLEMTNIHFLPIEILDASIGDSIDLILKNNYNILQANKTSSPVEFQTLKFSLSKNIEMNDTILDGLIIKYRILGIDEIRRENVIPYSILDELFVKNDLIRQKPNVERFDFLILDHVNKQIIFERGEHQLSSNLIIPRNYKVQAFPGTKIDMIENSCIISYSPLSFQGNEEDLITFWSSDSSAQGITVLSAGIESNLHHVKFEGLSNPDQAGWFLTSAITFYESPVIVESCLFQNNLKGDDYLNIVRCRYSINNSSFVNVKADAFDGDFSDGVINNTSFINLGNDAIDVSGSKVLMNNVYIKGAGDKGISAGEASTVVAHDMEIRNSEIAITSKDLSSVEIDHVYIFDSRIAYAAFQKKSEFGPATIEIVKNSQVSGQCEIMYLIEKESKLIISGEEKVSSMNLNHVKEILYGVKYGKSSG